MNIYLSEEQEMLKKTARDFLSNRCPKTLVREMEESVKGYSPELWKEIAELGWMGLVFPEKYGGGGMSFLDLAVLLEEMGRACLPGPFFSAVVLGGLSILDLGSEEQKQEYLPKIASGEVIFTLALTEASAQYDVASVRVRAAADKGDEYEISGTKLFVPDAQVADYLLCVARTSESAKPEDGITIFIVDGKSSGISHTLLKTTAGDKLCEVIFDQVKVSKNNILGQLDQGGSEVQKIVERAAVAKCCEMVGGMQRVLEMTVDYAKDRRQFDHPIGSFQAVQHHCANMLIDVDSSRLITYEAAWRISQGLRFSEEAAMAKSWLSDAYRRVVTLGHQVHGGVGLIEDHDMPLYLKRAKSGELAFGDSRFHRRKLANRLLSGGVMEPH